MWRRPGALYLKESCGALIGFGGGSAIDCAKAVGARIARPKTPIRSMKGILRVLRRIPLLIAVPTTAGTGSEVTLASVITDSESGHKFPINDFPLTPVAVLDVENTRSLPPAMTATTGMDADPRGGGLHRPLYHGLHPSRCAGGRPG